MTEYEFNFSQQEVELVLTGLAELPLKTSGAIYSKIQQSAIAQQKAHEAPAGIRPQAAAPTEPADRAEAVVR